MVKLCSAYLLIAQFQTLAVLQSPVHGNSIGNRPKKHNEAICKHPENCQIGFLCPPLPLSVTVCRGGFNTLLETDSSSQWEPTLALLILILLSDAAGRAKNGTSCFPFSKISCNSDKITGKGAASQKCYLGDHLVTSLLFQCCPRYRQTRLPVWNPFMYWIQHQYLLRE